MIAAVPVVLYLALACATVKPPVTATPKKGAPSTQPVEPNLPVICKQLNELGVQSHPSLNPN